MKLDLPVWERESKVNQENLSPAEKTVILDQVNAFWRDKRVGEEEEELALSYAVTLADALYFYLFFKGDLSSSHTNVQAIKLLIQARWGRRRR